MTGMGLVSSPLSDLICGSRGDPPPTPPPELLEILEHLRSSIDYLMDELRWLGEQPPQRVAGLGPFIARALLEVAVTAIIARLDPMRVFVVRRIQEQPSYDTRVAWKASIRWQGDVLAEKPKQLWGPTLEYRDITRALLGDYYDEVIWRPAVGRLLDAPLDSASSAWLADLRALTVDSFVARRRLEISQIYSALSKGVHPEFVMPPGALYDRNTVRDLVDRTIHAIADIGLVSHLIPHAGQNLPFDVAIVRYMELESVEVMK